MYFNHRTLKLIGKTILKIIKLVLKGSFLLFGFIFFVLRNMFRLIRNIYLANKLGYDIDEVMNGLHKMSPRQFEVFCASLFKAMGYKTTLTPETCDGGKDIILEKDGDITFVECKRFAEGNLVGREICQKLLGSMAQYGADNGIVITTGSFHKNAIECKKSVRNLELIDKNDIYTMVLTLKSKELPKIMLKTLNYA